MPSPFPGMNPYLEQDDAWEDFHQRFATVTAEVLESQAGPHYFVKIEERLYIHDAPEEPRRFVGRTDVSVADLRPEVETAAGVAILEAPVRVPAVDVERSAYLEIRDRRNRRLVTVLELLSPSNKRAGEDRERYLTKRGELLCSRAHFVEIDLLRGYARMPLQDPLPCSYCVLVSRAEERRNAGLWPIHLRDPLPLVPIPLQAPDPDLRLDLQAVLHRVYDAANYQKYIYAGTPEPPLSPEEETWARQVLAAAGVGSP